MVRKNKDVPAVRAKGVFTWSSNLIISRYNLLSGSERGSDKPDVVAATTFSIDTEYVIAYGSATAPL